MTRISVLCLAGLSLLALTSPCHGAGHPFTELEIPVPQLFGTHARALGMGGAHIAVAEDASALTWNPAGLANVRRIEISGSFARSDRENETGWHGGPDSWGGAENQLGGLHYIYPFPTYRGALVVALGADRMRDYSLRYRRSGVDPEIGYPGDDPSFGSALLTDTHERDGKLSGYSAAVGWEVSPRLAVGLTATYLRGSIYDEQTFLTEDAFGVSSTYVSYEDFYLLDAKLTGWTGMAGFIYKASPHVRFGGVLGAPRYITVERFEQLRTRDLFENGSESIGYEDLPSFPDEEITFPYWLGFGVSVGVRGVLLAADLRHTDYQEIEDKVGATEFFVRPYYKDVTSFALGAEVLAPNIPLRLRGGYRYDPAPFRLTYCPTGDCDMGEGRDPREIDVAIDRERHFFSAGAGYLFEGIFTVDFAFETGSYERVIEGSDPNLYQEERHSDQYILTVGYRF